MNRIDVYTDGSCGAGVRWQDKIGGWAWCCPEEGEEDSGHERATTNQRMELRAALEAVGHWESPITIVSDSAYVVNCFLERWWIKWKENDTVASRPNGDLWAALIDLALERDVAFRHVRGHKGIPGNEMADRLAGSARRLGLVLAAKEI